VIPEINLVLIFRSETVTLPANPESKNPNMLFRGQFWSPIYSMIF
jgi:hypothetical protein